MNKLGVLVVGQSPRPEVESELKRIVGGVELDLRGCLDGLSRAEIDGLQPEDGDVALFTRLPNGEGVRLSKKQVVRHGSYQLDALERAGAKLVIILCTGGFPEWRDRRVLLPSAIMHNFVFGLLSKGHIGVLSPLEEQVPATLDRWTDENHRVSSIALSPNASIDEARQAGQKMQQLAPDLIVFDCVSYTRETKHVVCSTAEKPGVLAITTIARCAAELLETGSPEEL